MAEPASRGKGLGRGILAMHAMLGLSRWAAAGLAAEAGWAEEARSAWDGYARRVLWSRTLLAVLDQVAAGSPAVASQRTCAGGLAGAVSPGGAA